MMVDGPPIAMDPVVYNLALKAHQCAHKTHRTIRSKGIITIIDYSQPSIKKRLWVVNVKKKRVLYHTYVAHGISSGFIKPTRFSNKLGSYQSSIGLYLTGKAYWGSHGYSLRLEGLEKGFNDNATSRAIVMHGASYANASYVTNFGMLGHSWGCPAVGKRMARPVINKIRNGSLLFIYYPQKKWLKTSEYFHC